MPLSDKKKVSNGRYMGKLDNILIRPYRAEGEQIRSAAADAGQSLQGYILQAVRDRMQRESGADPGQEEE